MSEMIADHFVYFKNILDQYDADELVINGNRGRYLFGAFGSKEISNEIKVSSFDLLEGVRELVWSQGLRLDPNHPSCGGFIEPLSLRWHAVIRPVADDDLILSIRNLRLKTLDLAAFKLEATVLDKIQSAVSQKWPLVISGATGVGKTSLLVAILKNFFLSHRTIIVESIAEIPLVSNSWVRMVECAAQVSGKGAYSLEEVAKSTLRLRPEVLVVGELRGSEAKVFLDLSISGHGGCLTTIHADSTQSALIRLRRLAGEQIKNFPEDLPLLIVQMQRDENNKICVKNVDECLLK